MGKASSSKKVARAAGTGGGRTHRGRTPWIYYSVLALVVVLGITRHWASRDRRLPDQQRGRDRRRRSARSGTRGTPSHVRQVSAGHHPRQGPGRDHDGDGDGIIHIHPTAKSAAGKNATLGKFADAVGMKLNAAELQMPGGKLYATGTPARASRPRLRQGVRLSPATPPAPSRTSTRANVPLQDQSLLTIAFVPASPTRTRSRRPRRT